MAQTTETPPLVPKQNPPSPEPVPISEKDLRWKQLTSSRPRLRVMLIIGFVTLLVAAFFLWGYFASYESTDDAQIDGHLNPISARVSGYVVKLLVADNQYVAAGTPLLQIDPKDYQVAVARAQSDYADALATAQAA